MSALRPMSWNKDADSVRAEMVKAARENVRVIGQRTEVSELDGAEVKPGLGGETSVDRDRQVGHERTGMRLRHHNPADSPHLTGLAPWLRLAPNLALL